MAYEGPTSAFNVVIDKTLTVTQGGAPREVTLEEALQHQTYREAIAGSRMAQRQVLKMIFKRENARASRVARHRPPPEIRMEPVDPDNANQALLILGIACHDPRWDNDPVPSEYERLLLEPWAVQTALSRRRGGERLSKKEVEEVKRCTRKPDTLCWPRGTGE